MLIGPAPEWPYGQVTQPPVDTPSIVLRNHGTFRGRDAAIKAIVRNIGAGVECLRLSKDGHPGHPRYLPAAAQRIPFVEART